MRSSGQNPDHERGGSPSTSESPEATATSDPGTSASDPFGTVLRFMIALSGTALIICGAVAAFVVANGVATAALVAAGFALLFIGYLGRNITRVRFRDFEAELAWFREKTVATLQVVEDRAAEVVGKLQEVSRSYESVRAAMASGGMRDIQMERQLAEAMRLVIAGRMSFEEVKRRFRTNDAGDRILVLAAMRADPSLRDSQIILEAIEHPESPFEQDRFLLLASEMLGDLDPGERRRLREVVERQRDRRIKPGMARWFTSERLFYLLDRVEDDSRQMQ